MSEARMRDFDAEPPAMIMWVIFDHPHDYPDHWVVRRNGIDLGDPEPWVDSRVQLARSLDEARWMVPPGLIRLRMVEETPPFAECWL